MEIALKVRVELGRREKEIKDMVEMWEGWIMEVEKVGGEGVEMVVNDKVIGKGEVVVVKNMGEDGWEGVVKGGKKVKKGKVIWFGEGKVKGVIEEEREMGG
ncbi:FliM/FliN family flagellar motor switch protein, partial [Paenibacillus sp. Y412MC10]|uniref:FliM/FliN family flagellar motor switch protein n=1 Tax=Geobacillus sp. (strain Y412MC10) TaxID=481743 RepID=UPI0021B31B91